MAKRAGAQAWRRRRDEALAAEIRGLSPQQLDERLAALEARERQLLLEAERPGSAQKSEPPELRRLRNELSRLQDSRPLRLRDIFLGASIPDAERLLARRIQEIEHAARLAADAASDRAEKARQELAIVRASIRAGKLVRREAGDERTRAQAAAYRDQAREPAGALRRRSPVPDRCPYCLRAADAWELDHIHPVSKGGLSVDANCVMICTDCNRAKGTLLLRQFCREQGWDFGEVAARLEAIGKDI